MAQLELIRSEVRRSFRGPAWHGPALSDVLADLSAAEAVQHPVVGAHSAAELLLHALAWTEEVARRLSGGEAALPERGDWPSVPELDEATWSSLRQALEAAAQDLDHVLARLPPERLQERVAGPAQDPPLGSGIRFDVMLHGLAQHNAYHGGQIAILKRALRPDDAAEGRTPSAPVPA